MARYRFVLTFIILVGLLLTVNNSVYFVIMKKTLEHNVEERMESIAEEIRISNEISDLGLDYVDRLLSNQLRMAAIEVQSKLPPDYESVTNEQLKRMAEADEFINGITLFKRTKNDVIPVKSSDPKELEIRSTKDWGPWFQAYTELFDLKDVTVPKGKALKHFWSGPTEFATSSPTELTKWGNYYDGTTNYMLCVFIQGNEFIEYQEITGPEKVLTLTKASHDNIIEIAILNPETFGKEVIVDVNSNNETWVKLMHRPVMYGTYQYGNEKEDAAAVREAYDRATIVSYSDTLEGKKVLKTFVPVERDFLPYVISFVTDYEPIQKELNQQFVRIGWIIVLASAIGAVVLMTFFRLMKRTANEAISTTQEQYIAQMNELFVTIQGQRHDFLNHVNMISTLAHMGKIEELKAYTKQFSQEVEGVNEILMIGQPAISALINSKLALASARGIHVVHEFKDMSRLSLGALSIDIVRIVVNLIDNAFDEVVKLPPEQRLVEIRGWGNSIHFLVRNAGTHLSSEDIEIIFTPGYSTKNTEIHTGLGLAIVKERIDANKGKLTVTSSEVDGVTFQVAIPLL